MMHKACEVNTYNRAHRCALLVKNHRIGFSEALRRIQKTFAEEYLCEWPSDATRFAWYLLREELDKLENFYS